VLRSTSVTTGRVGRPHLVRRSTRDDTASLRKQFEADEISSQSGRSRRRKYRLDASTSPLSEQHLALLIDSVKDYAILMLDPAGLILTWNDGAERIKGYSRAEIVGPPMSTFYTPEDIASELPAQLLATAAQHGRVENEGWRLRKDGTRFFADVVISAMRDSSGQLVGFSKVTRDLTERRALLNRLEPVSQPSRVEQFFVEDHPAPRCVQFKL
jgi:PAS domain S-box-containing protein